MISKKTCVEALFRLTERGVDMMFGIPSVHTLNVS
jgi:hypothetical protein